MASGSPSVLRALNDRAALEILLRETVVSRAELETLTGLSKPATSQLLNRLEAVGLVERVGLREGVPGPRAQLWSLKADAGHVAGVDVTAAGIDVAVADLRGSVLSQHYAKAESGKGGHALDVLIAALAGACEPLGIESRELAHVAIGMPGAVDPASGQLRYASDLPDWKGINLLAVFRDQLPVPVTVENDVNLVALSEMTHGAAESVSDFVFLWLSDRGVGSSVIIRGELLRGATLGAGEIGFTPVPDLALTATPPTGGRFGDRLASTAIVELAMAHGIRASNGVEAVRRSLAEPDAGAGFVVDLARRISAGLAGVVSLIDPELIVLGGDIGLAGGAPLCREVSRALHELVEQEVDIQPGQDGSGSVRSGAVQAALIPARERYFAAGSTGDIA